MSKVTELSSYKVKTLSSTYSECLVLMKHDYYVCQDNEAQSEASRAGKSYYNNKKNNRGDLRDFGNL